MLQVPLVPRTAAAPSPAGLPADIISMPRFFDRGDWGGRSGGGDFGRNFRGGDFGGSFAFALAVAVAPGAASFDFSVRTQLPAL